MNITTELTQIIESYTKLLEMLLEAMKQEGQL